MYDAHRNDTQEDVSSARTTPPGGVAKPMPEEMQRFEPVTAKPKTNRSRSRLMFILIVSGSMAHIT